MIANYTLYADKVILTANYYMEYLGFNLLYKVEDQENPYVWLELNGQFLLIWPWAQKLGVPKPIQLEVNDIDEYYSELAGKVKMMDYHSTIPDKSSSFTITDCEGNLIRFYGKGRFQAADQDKFLEGNEIADNISVSSFF